MKNMRWQVFILALGLITLWGFKAEAQNPKDIVDVFSGRINKSDITQIALHGRITYDRNCLPVEGGLTRCDAGIKTSQYGVINFNYTHNMREEPCLIDGDKVLLKVKKDQQAWVIR